MGRSLKNEFLRELKKIGRLLSSRSNGKGIEWDRSFVKKEALVIKLKKIGHWLRE